MESDGEFGDQSIKYYCPKCKSKVETVVREELQSNWGRLLACLCCIVGGCQGTAVLNPFIKYIHECPDCKTEIGSFNKS